jgi:hypothetical protein
MGASSMIVKEAQSSNFLFGQSGKGAIGFDGLGAIECPRADKYLLEIGEVGATVPLDLFLSDDTKGTPRIRMRRAVRPFDLLYIWKLNALLVSEELYAGCEEEIVSSVDKLVVVECMFGTKNLPYFVGSLNIFNAYKNDIDWLNSEFVNVDSSDFVINMTKIDRKEVDPKNTVRFLSEKVKFESYEEYRNIVRSDITVMALPQKLSLLGGGDASIVNFDPILTLYSPKLVECLSGMKRPKNRVSGLVFSLPEIELQTS